MKLKKTNGNIFCSVQPVLWMNTIFRLKCSSVFKICKTVAKSSQAESRDFIWTLWHIVYFSKVT